MENDSMNSCAPQVMREVTREEFEAVMRIRNWKRDGWSNGLMYADAVTGEKIGFYQDTKEEKWFLSIQKS